MALLMASSQLQVSGSDLLLLFAAEIDGDGSAATILVQKSKRGSNTGELGRSVSNTRLVELAANLPLRRRPVESTIVPRGGLGVFILVPCDSFVGELDDVGVLDCSGGLTRSTSL